MSTIVNEKGGRIWGLTWTAAFVLNPPVNIFISICCPLKLYVSAVLPTNRVIQE